MKTIIAVLLWFILFSISWPLALILLFFFVLAWIILIPFKIIGFTLEAIFKLNWRYFIVSISRDQVTLIY
jgi:hypothetical protein